MKKATNLFIATAIMFGFLACNTQPAKEEVELMMFVTAENVNTGDLENDRTLPADSLERI